ncbi:energy transducer TonB [Parapedobacter soli]|uniref:energy transducer TonB n=1 Tax=Parapedobacter soli TaxID=416955 RepID=UPI0021C61D70|nr:energy transducer TonB [Parapedobacter soli]
MEKGKVDIEFIRRYIRGELTPREMYVLERQAQADPMLMDIILGMEQETLDVHDDHLADIRKRIAECTGQRQTATRRLAPLQRWAVAASILAVLTVGAWWFTREDAIIEQHEATVAATSEQTPEMPEAEAKPLPEPEAPATKERVADTAPRTVRIAAADVAAANQAEKKEERLAMVTPKADTGTGLLDSTIVVGYGTQQRSAPTGVAARLVAAEMDTAVAASARAAENPNKPSPKEGWDAYRQYLRNAVKLAPGQGVVDLAFTVDDEGRPTDIAVIETTNEKLNTFAILIVRDGPRWLRGNATQRDVTLRITF